MSGNFFLKKYSKLTKQFSETLLIFPKLKNNWITCIGLIWITYIGSIRITYIGSVWFTFIINLDYLHLVNLCGHCNKSSSGCAAVLCNVCEMWNRWECFWNDKRIIRTTRHHEGYYVGSRSSSVGRAIKFKRKSGQLSPISVRSLMLWTNV